MTVAKIESLINYLADTEVKIGQSRPVDIDFDNLREWHDRFIYSASCLRARNYRLDEPTRLAARIYVGRLIAKTTFSQSLVASVASM